MTVATIAVLSMPLFFLAFSEYWGPKRAPSRLNYWPVQRVIYKVGNGALAQVPGRVDWMELLAELTAMY
jgi:hypothetical protein